MLLLTVTMFWFCLDYKINKQIQIVAFHVLKNTLKNYIIVKSKSRKNSIMAILNACATSLNLKWLTNETSTVE